MTNRKLKIKEVKRIRKSDVIILDDLIMRPLQDEKDEDIVGLSTSLDSNGMINEIDIRESKTVKGKYELMAGARRFVATKEEFILAKVFENVSDLKAMVLGVIENDQRRNPDINIRDASYYKIWKKGKDEGVYTYMSDLAHELGKDENLVREIIHAGEEKDSQLNPIIQNASSTDLNKTKKLVDHPDLREDLLKKRQDSKITAEDMEKISDEIKNELDTGTEKNDVKKVLEIIDSPKIPEIVGTTVTNNIDNLDSKISEPVKISDRKFTDTLQTFKKSPPDIQKKLEKREIDVGEAKLLNQFDTPARREKVLNDLKVAQEVHDLDNKRTVDIRLKQQEDLNNKGETDLKTRQDRALEEELKKERFKDQTHDQRCLDRYQRMSSYILETVSGFSPKALRTGEVKAKTVKIFRGNYELFHSILVVLGDIREIRPENIKREKSIDISGTIVNADIIDAVVVESKEE